MARLFLTFNSKVVSSHPIMAGQELTIGRSERNKIIVDHPAISHTHAKFFCNEQGLHLSDLGSTNGTFVNNERVMTIQLGHQDWVFIGKHLIVVDIYETLSLEAATQMLKGESSGVADADGTMMLDMVAQPQTYIQELDFLSFMTEGKEDFELTERPVYIGKNKDADILIRGLWTLLSGEPAARIEKHSGDYYLEYVSGVLKPKINNQSIRRPTKLAHQDVIKIGPLKMQINRTKMTVSQ